MDCPACGGSDWRAGRVQKRLSIRTCVGCGLLTSEIDAAETISYADFEDATYEDALGSLRRSQVAEIVRFARAHAAQGGWLDVGCGPGYLLAEAAAAGFRVSGIEPDPQAASLARNQLGADAIREGVLLGPEPSPVDVISTLDVLEHIPIDGITAFADAIRSSLTSDGVWVIKLPSTEGLYFRIAHALGLSKQIERLWQVGYASPHTVYFASDTISQFLARHGFRVMAFRYLQELPVRTAFARLTMRGTTSRWQAALAIPAVAAINAVEWLRRKSDALVVIARPL